VTQMIEWVLCFGFLVVGDSLIMVTKCTFRVCELSDTSLQVDEPPMHK
jgi:hypothetical protein